MMRGERIERFLLLPFSIGCDSDSSVALAATTTATSPSPKRTRVKGGEKNSKTKNRDLSKASFSQGLLRLIRRFKSFSHFFLYKEEMGDKMEREMEIGFPTDVKHVTHIGLDGSTTINNTNPINSNWDSNSNNELLQFPSISLHQFEIAMSAQSHQAPLGIK
ncbi:hypothetical protein ABFS83_14G042600 [Erythranthe nasuta]